MKIAIMFLFFSGIFIIGTLIYLSYKKTNINQNIKNKTIEKEAIKPKNKNKNIKQL